MPVLPEVKVTTLPVRVLGVPMPCRSFGSALLAPLQSREVAMSLLVVVLCTTLAGTIIPQRSLTPAADFQLWQQDHASLAAIADALGLSHVYTAWWFSVLLGFLVISLGLCSVNRARSLWRYTHHQTSPVLAEQIRQLKHFVEIAPLADAETSSFTASTVLRKRGYSLREGGPPSRWWAVADKNGVGAWGSVVLHLGLLIVLLGGFYSGATKAAGYIELVEGQSFVESHDGYTRLDEAPFFGERHAGFRMRLDRLQTEFWPNGGLRDIRSQVTVYDGGRAPDQASIWVNGALVHRGVTIYQSRRHGFAAVIGVADAQGQPIGEGTVNFPTPASGNRPAFQTFRLPQPDWQVLADFYPNWGKSTVPEDWQMARPSHPALFLTVREATTTVYSGMLALGQSVTIGRFELSFTETRRWAGFPVLHDPGIGIVFGGFALCIAGAALSFMLVPRRLWLAVVREDQGRQTLLVGGRTAKYQPAFGEEFAALASTIVDEIKEVPCSAPRSFSIGLP